MEISKSKANYPNWLTGLESDYIIAKGEGLDFVSAKKDAMKAVREQMAMEIVQFVEARTEISFNNAELNKQIKSKALFNSQSSLITPGAILMGTSVSKASDFYWEKRSSGGNTKVIYYLKYPFSSAERDSLTKDWVDFIEESNRAINLVLAKKYSNSHMSELKMDLDFLKGLDPFLKSARAMEIEARVNWIESLIQGLHLESQSSGPGFIDFHLRGAGKYWRYDPDFRFADNRIQTIKIKVDGSKARVYFKLKGLSELKTRVELSVMGRIIQKQITLSAYEDEVKFSHPSILSVEGLKGDISTIQKAKFHIPFEIRSKSKINVKRIRIYPRKYWKNWWSGRTESQSLPALNFSFNSYFIEGPSAKTMIFSSSTHMNRFEYGSKRTVRADIFIEYVSYPNQEAKQVRFNNILIKTNW